MKYLERATNTAGPRAAQREREGLARLLAAPASDRAQMQEGGEGAPGAEGAATGGPGSAGPQTTLRLGRKHPQHTWQPQQKGPVYECLGTFWCVKEVLVFFLAFKSMIPVSCMCMTCDGTFGMC